MKEITREQFDELIALLPIKYEKFDNGTVRLTLTNCINFKNIDSECHAVIFMNKCFLIGREACPPLKNVTGDQDIENIILTQNRTIVIDTKNELVSIVKELLARGWCVDNDVYIIEQNAHWILYISHHDEVTYYEGDV